MNTTAVTTPTPTAPTPTSSPTSSGSGAVRQSLRGQELAVQQRALTPRPVRAVQREARVEGTNEATNGDTRETSGETAAQAVARWSPRLAKVCDPVAFMTSGAKGNYNAAIGNARDKAGFFEQAKAELGAIATEVRGFTGDDAASLAALAALADSWAAMYGALQSTGMTEAAASDPAARAKVQARVRQAVDGTGGALRVVLGGTLLDRATGGTLGNAWDEISLFVDSWNDVSGGQSSASPYMWAAFLQTIERYRSVLNQYGKLEARGGDASGTAKMQVKDSDPKKGMVADAGRFEEVSADKGGGMAMALETYHYRVGNIAECQKQTAAMLARVERGEFETAEAAVAEFRKTIGAGLGSEAFYKNVEELAKGAWLTQHGDQLVADGDLAAKQAYKCYKLSQEARERSDKSMTRAEDAHEEHTERAGEMDKTGADDAYEAVLHHKKNAERRADEAVAYAGAGDQRLATAKQRYTEAETDLANAEVALSKVDADRFPHLSPGVTETRGKLNSTRGKLAQSKEDAVALEEVGAEIRERALAAKKIAGDYDPAKHEVACPAAIEGASAEHYQKFSLSLFVSPVWWLTIKGGADGQWGTIHEEGGLKSFTEASGWGGIEIDLCLLTLELGYRAKTRYEVEGLATPGQVEERGAAEKAKWDSAKEVADSGAQERLNSAFTTERAAMHEVYRGLAESADTYLGDGDAMRYGRDVDLAVLSMMKAQKDLMLGVMFNSGGDFYEGAKEAGKLPDPARLADDIASLKAVPKTAAAFEAGKQKEAHDALMRDTQDKSNERFEAIAGFKNDPSVSFESTGATYAGVKVGGAGFSVGYQYERATTVSDGDGETFDFAERTSTVHQIGFESKWLSGALKLVFKGDDEWGLEAEAEIVADLGDEHEQKEAQTKMKSQLAQLRDILKGKSSGYDILMFAKKHVEKVVEDTLAKAAKPEIEMGNELSAEFGLGVEKGKEGWHGEFTIGFARKIEREVDAGFAGGSASWTGGMRVTVPLF